MPDYTKDKWFFCELDIYEPPLFYIGTKDAKGMISSHTTTNSEANARIIAKAPEMYKLLKDFINSDAETDSAEYQLLQTVAAEVLNNIDRKDNSHDKQPPKQR